VSAVPKTPALTQLGSSNEDNRKLLEKFDARKSNELVIALAGPIGCGISTLVSGLKDRLLERGCVAVIHIKLSDFLTQAIADKMVKEWPSQPNASARLIRYRRLQEAGKELRRLSGNPAILAEYAAREIAIDRQKRQLSQGQLSAAGPVVPARVAYLIDQVKRPEEVALLRAVYRNLFYLAGVTRIYDRRVAALEAEDVRTGEVSGLMEIDRLEDGQDGQQLDKTLHLADYFVRNDGTTVEEQRRKLNRFLDLVHGDKSVTPTDSEQGMYAAYCAGLRSACLSRQVGAAIATSSGEVIATGCNDVPRAGGGLYTASSSGSDKRCVHLGGQECFNDLHKRKLQGDIADAVLRVLETAENGPVVLSLADREKLSATIYKTTRLKDLIEFSRSVHAEMDAIVSLARIGGAGLGSGATLYTTTFPCHNCARHIVASGIGKVFYVEPYEKSLAKDLHSDAIAFEVEESKDQKNGRVEFLHFEGVSPRQFHNMFRAVTRKNSEGKFVPIKIQEADKVVPEYLDGYQDFEAKAVEHLVGEIAKLTENILVDNQNLAGNN
jgi:deoxycytidylate deaminase